MNVFITGATGFVGSHVLTALKEAGHRPLALVRPGSEKKLPFFEGDYHYPRRCDRAGRVGR